MKTVKPVANKFAFLALCGQIFRGKSILQAEAMQKLLIFAVYFNELKCSIR
jgi:hypothetical protein